MAWAVSASLRFPSPLIKPDVRISRIRLSDKSPLCLRPRQVNSQSFQSQEPEPLVEMLRGKRLASRPLDLMLSPSFATGAVGGPRRPINTRSGLEGLHYGRLCRQRFDLAAGGDSGRGLRGKFQAALGEQEFLVFVECNVAPED